MTHPKIAIVHDWLTGMRGGEKCLEVFCELFPEATVFTLIHDKGSVSRTIEEMDIRTSFLQKVPGISKSYRSFLPFFPKAIESFDLTGYDLVLSSSHCAAKGVKIPQGALHICYCYTPVRYAWKFFDEYFSNESSPKRWVISQIMKRFKKWDLKTNKRIDYFIAISDNVKNRISKYYDRKADVIYPPVDVRVRTTVRGAVGGTASFWPKRGCPPHCPPHFEEEFYLMVSALVPYKRVDLAVKAFSESKKRLLVVGDGGELNALKKIAGDNVEFVGWVGDEDLKGYYSACKALIFPGEEDFGIVPLEAQAYGKPVIAYGAGGALETIVPFEGKQEGSDATGVFFEEQTTASLNEAVSVLEKNRGSFYPDKIKANAVRFGRDRFKKEIEEYVKEKWEQHGG